MSDVSLPMNEEGTPLSSNFKGTESSIPHATQGYGTVYFDPSSRGAKEAQTKIPISGDKGGAAGSIESNVAAYFYRMCGRETGQGEQHKGNMVKPFWVIFFNWVGSFVGLALVGYVDSLLFPDAEAFLLVGSYGATAVSCSPPTFAKT